MNISYMARKSRRRRRRRRRKTRRRRRHRRRGGSPSEADKKYAKKQRKNVAQVAAAPFMAGVFQHAFARRGIDIQPAQAKLNHAPKSPSHSQRSKRRGGGRGRKRRKKRTRRRNRRKQQGGGNESAGDGTTPDPVPKFRYKPMVFLNASAPKEAPIPPKPWW